MMARGVKGSGPPRKRSPPRIDRELEPFAIKVAKAGGLGPRPIERSAGMVLPIGAHVRPPRFLDRIAAAEWRRIVRLQDAFAERGLSWVSEIDAAALAAYCVGWSIWCRAVRGLGRTPTLLEADADGLMREAIAIRVEREARKALLAAAKELGFTSMVRARVQAGQIVATADGEVDDLLA